MKTIKVYVAGKVSNDSVFGRHDWRDDFLKELAKLTGFKFISFDPTRPPKNYEHPELVFGSDVHMISKIDVLIAYLTDDVSVGTSQEILIAKYYSKPVIALAPLGGKFNGTTRPVGKQIIKNYKHPFVFSTCDVVCDDVKAVAKALKNLDKIKTKTIDIIPELGRKFEEHSGGKGYISHSVEG